MGDFREHQRVSNGELVYANTVMDAVRFVTDEAVQFRSKREGVADLLADSSRLMLREMQTEGAGPGNVFSMSLPSLSRKLTLYHLRKVASSLLDAEPHNPIPARPSPGITQIDDRSQASAAINKVIARIDGEQPSAMSALNPSFEPETVRRAVNIVTARLEQSRDATLQQPSKKLYWQQEWDEKSAPAVMLADSIRETAEWALEQMFTLALRGETTAGRMATCFGIKLKPDSIRHHEPVASPAAQVVRELRMMTGVISEDLESGNLRQEAIRIYAGRMQRLGQQTPAPAEADYQRAAENAQLHLTTVMQMMTDIMAGPHRLPRAPVLALPRVKDRRDLH